MENISDENIIIALSFPHPAYDYSLEVALCASSAVGQLRLLYLIGVNKTTLF